MTIDLTDAFNVLHGFWDVAGVILLGLIIVFMPITIVVASAIKIRESREAKIK